MRPTKATKADADCRAGIRGDNMIAGAPNAFVHDGKIFLIYSGSLVGIDYNTGLSPLCRPNADLMTSAAWSKLDYPLQKSGIYNGQWQLGARTWQACGPMMKTVIPSGAYFTMPNTITVDMADGCIARAARTGPRKACRFSICSRWRIQSGLC